MVPRIGTEFAGYRIVALLGRGGMSVVYRAENPRLGMTVALKVLAPELADNESFRERFVSESRLAAALNHPNIITLYDAGEADGSLYIAMRYVPSDLRSTLEADGPLPTERSLAILHQVAGALDAAHAEGLIHRDVKPGNILLDGSGERPELAYLADFGLTKHISSQSGLTAPGEFLGTIDYMAPEQIQARPVDGRADLYSLGCVAYECLTGVTPFPRENEPAVLWAHMQEPPPRPSERRPGLAAGVDEVFASALAKSPDDRFAACGEFVSALDASLDGPRTLQRTRSGAPPSPKPPPPAEPDERLPRKPRRWGRVLAVGAALAAAAAGGAAAVFVGFDRDGERVVTQTSTVRPPPGELTAFDRALVRLIPAGIRGTCEHATPISDGFDSTVVCRPGGRVQGLQYSHARSGHLLRDYLRERVVAVGLPLEEDAGLTAFGSCDTDEPALHEWEFFGQTGHREASSQQLEAEGVGRGEVQRRVLGHVLCSRQDGRFTMEWIDHRAGVYSRAAGPRDRLIEWWRSSAGPIH